MSLGSQTKERTGRISTQGSDQVVPYSTRTSFELISGQPRLTTKYCLRVSLSALVTLMVDTRQDYATPTVPDYNMAFDAVLV